jgi:hypothetical protein
MLGDDPFGAKNGAADYALGTDFETAQIIPQNTTLTVQLWARQRTVPTDSAAWLFSNIDLSNDSAYGGLGIGLGINGVAFAQAPLNLVGSTIEVAEADTAWPSMGDWHFIRVVQTGGNLNLCIDGKQGASVAVTDGHLQTIEPLLLGRNRFGQGGGDPFFDGLLSDVRIFKGALPCE